MNLVVKTLLLFLTAESCAAESLVAAMTIAAGTTITPAHIELSEKFYENAIRSESELLEQQTNQIIYAGAPFTPQSIQKPILVDRNQVIELIYLNSQMAITTSARALEKGSLGQKIRVMNLTSRKVLKATVKGIGRAEVE